MVSESIHHHGLEKKLPPLPFETLYETDEIDEGVVRPREEISGIEQALALAIAMQSIGSISILEECSGEWQSGYNNEDPALTELSNGEPHNPALSRRTEEMQSRYREAVSGIDACCPDDQSQEMTEDFGGDIWLELADEEMKTTFLRKGAERL